jgi:hypothetical protein
LIPDTRLGKVGFELVKTQFTFRLFAPVTLVAMALEQRAKALEGPRELILGRFAGGQADARPGESRGERRDNEPSDS